MQREDGTGAGARWRARASEEPAAPTSAGRYRIDGVLGRGGVGSVYRAYDNARVRMVALKRLELDAASISSQSASAHTHSDDARKQARRRAQLTTLFQREFHTLAQLTHPRIIEVYDYGIDEHGPFYTMELLDGQDLSQAAPLPWQRACEVLRDVASALTLLHSRRLLHRDISPRNVHCSSSGPAKLIDFGAMSPMGPCDMIIGTPAFVAPEVLQSQTLDARTDLYSLGALAYLVLTGRAAYSARSFDDVRDAFRSHPPHPSSIVPDIPSGLDALVMQLLSLDRSGRPSSAVELVERLTVLGKLQPDARLAVPSMYLATPSLVGRHKELLAVRRRVLRTRRGHGASLCVVGPPGVGRSRFLDACALEGKLAGSLVLRGAPGASGGAEYGVIRNLLLQLHSQLSQAERKKFELPLDLSSQLALDLIWTRANSEPTSMRLEPTADPSELARRLQLYFEHLAARRSLMILVDDFQDIDETSAVVFAALAQLTSRSRMVMVGASTTGAPVNAQAALRLLKSYSRVVPLQPLHLDEVESLLASVFGAVPNLPQLAHRLHSLSEGKPRVCMELAQHLVDNHLIRYETGGFVLPEVLVPGDMPASVEEALRGRFVRLSRGAQDLGCVAAMCSGALLTVEQILRVAGLAGSMDGDRALTELVASQLITVDDDHVTLRQASLASALLRGQDEVNLRRLRLRVAESFASQAELCARGAQHYFAAGEDALGLDTLLGPARTGRLTYDLLPNVHEVIELGLSACHKLGRPRLESFLLRQAKLHHRLHFIEPGDTTELLAFGEELSRMSGLSYWHQLGLLEPNMDRAARLTSALEMASAEYDRASEHDRVYAVQDAITELARYVAALSGYATATFALDVLERIPSLGDFVLLAPGIQVAEWIVQALRDLRACRLDASRAGLWRVLARVEEADHAGLPDDVFFPTRLGVLYAVALTNASLGDRVALAQAEELEQMPSMRVAAWRVRLNVHLHLGDAQHAETCRRQLELLLIQHGSSQAHQGTTLETQLMCYAWSDDLLNLRRTLPEAEAMSAKHPGWRPILLIGQAELERIRGRLPEARVLYEQALGLAQPGRHMMWPYAIAFYIRCLANLGELEQAKAIALSALAETEACRMGMLGNLVAAAVAYAESKNGEVDAAIDRVDRLIDDYEARGISGLLAALVYEQRAQLAILAHDPEGLSRNVERAREHYGDSADSPFTARVARLFAAARAAGLVSDVTASLAEDSMIDAAVARLRRELAQCADLEERAERTVAALVEITGALGGHLYGLQNGRLVHLASSHDRPEPLLLDEMTKFIADTNREESDDTAIVDSSAELEQSHTATTSCAGVLYSLFAIQSDNKRALVVAAVALAYAPGIRRSPPLRLLSSIGEELTARGDLTQLTFVR